MKQGEILTFLGYFLIIFLATPSSLHWTVQAAFWLFAAYIFYITFYQSRLKTQNSESKIANWWIFLPLIIIIATRLTPFVRWHTVIPLGADAGTYIGTFNNCFASFAKAGCDWFSARFIATPLYLLGWQTEYIVYLLYLLIAIFVGLAIYIVTKEYFGRNAAFFSLFIYSISVSQFLAYFAFFWNMALALGIALTALYLLQKKSWLAIPVGGLVGPIHSAVFLAFGLTLLLHFIFQKNKKFDLLAGLGILLVSLSISGKELISLVPFYLTNTQLSVQQISNSPKTSFLEGTFIDSGLYRSLVLIYLPFAVVSLINLLKQKRFNYVFFFFAVNFVMVYFNLFFHNRFIILLDIAAVILAGPVLARFASGMWPSAAGKLAITLLALSGLYGVFYQSWFIKPYITNPADIAGIKTFPMTEKNSIIVNTSHLYRPYLNAYSQRKIIDLKFEGIETDYQTLDQYSQPLYIHIGEKTKNIPDLKENPKFIQINKNIWKYKK